MKFPWSKTKQDVQTLEKKIDDSNRALIELKARINIPTPQYQFNPVGGNFVMAPVFQDIKKYIDTGFNLNSTVYSIVSATSDKFGSIPWNFYKVKNERKAREYDLLSKAYTDSPHHLIKLIRLKAQAFDEMGDDNDLMRLWNNPNSITTGPDFRSFACMLKMLTGAAPILYEMGATRTKVLELQLLAPQFVQLWPDQTLNAPGRITYNLSGAQRELALEDVLYWKYNNPNFTITGEHLYGQSPLRAAGVEIDADNQNVLAQKFMFEHAGVAGLWTPKDVETAAAISANPVLADSLRETMDDLHNREESLTSRPFANAPLQYTSYGMDSKEMDLVLSRRLSKEFIANVYNYPLPLLSLERATDNNFDAAVRYLVTNTIYANLCSYRDRHNKVTIPKFGYKPGQAYLDFDITGLPEMQGDMKKMAETLDKMPYVTFDEKREVMKYDAKGGAYDTAYIPSGMIPIELAGDMGTIPNNGTF